MSKSKHKDKSILAPASVRFCNDYLKTMHRQPVLKAVARKYGSIISSHIDEYFVDNYGTAVGIINPKAAYR